MIKIYIKKNEDSNDVDDGKQGSKSDVGDSAKGGLGSSKGLFGNPSSFQKEISILKHKMVLLNKEMYQLRKTA